MSVGWACLPSGSIGNGHTRGWERSPSPTSSRASGSCLASSRLYDAAHAPFERETNGESLAIDDGLMLPEVGPWAVEKHRRIGYYASIFAASMKGRWNCRVFIDLFAGAGKAKLKESGRIIVGSPLVVLGLDTPFDKYLFCELLPEHAEALRKRVASSFPARDATVLNANANTDIEDIIGRLPRFDASYKGLSLCFVDPFNQGISTLHP